MSHAFDRRSPFALTARTAGALLAAAGLASSAFGDVWSWNTGNGNWMTAGNWSPGTTPGVDGSIFTDIRIGNLPSAANCTVLMNHAVGSGALYFDVLSISDGMTLDLNGRELGGLSGVTSLTSGGELIVRASNGPNFHDFTTRDLTLTTGTLLNLADNGRVRTGTLVSSGVIFGRGTIHVQGNAPGSALSNMGTISASGNGGLTIIQEGASRLDLDGYPAESVEFGQLSIASPFSTLTFQGDQLHDAFSGTVTMGTGSLLNMNMTNGWTADVFSTFNVSSSVLGAAAQINGGHFSFGGNLNIGGSQGHLRVLADAAMLSTADVFLGNDDRLEFDGATGVNGGLFTLSQGARIDFDGATSISGGTFNAVGNLPSQGEIRFNGATQWSGTTTINGFARQIGDATVNAPATINANVLDMDGTTDTGWTLNQVLTVNTTSIELGSQQFDGTMNINSSLFGRFILNLTDPSASWTMNGTMNLAGFGALGPVRVAGSRMIVSGSLNMGTGIARITADTAFQGAAVNIAVDGTLSMQGATTVDATSTFAGTGALRNNAGGTLLLHSGVNLASVGLINDAALRIGESGAGIASVNRFTSTAAATWIVDIGGYLAGSNHDILLVAGGPTLLGGNLLVSILAGFAPQIGDEFTILTSLGAVSGAFINDPITQVGGLSYDWSVVYNTNSVVLRLDNIVPTPGSLALLSLGILSASRRRRTH